MTSLAKAVGPLDGHGNLPLYQELQRALRIAINSRILGPDDALPSERDLAADFSWRLGALLTFSLESRAFPH